ncbi:hypothetical protein AAFF_G00229180 [Aldrovandia affinis]|uniref:Uncharacterized protein n=1 Tax=Aldrovandia affinis TaxID=143900 RepID=A0AAD7SVE3_9TELE|nr:hypothetical protein AAFF_G00229180 [Aldrovandia affinis]
MASVFTGRHRREAYRHPGEQAGAAGSPDSAGRGSTPDPGSQPGTQREITAEVMMSLCLDDRRAGPCCCEASRQRSVTVDVCRLSG